MQNHKVVSKAKPQPQDDTTLILARTFSAAREAVFRAWTDPAKLKQWFAPSDTHSTTMAEVDLCVGGRYAIEMRSPDGKMHRVTGVYREVLVPERLVFTWTWEAGGMDVGETLVTLEFHSHGNATEVILTHARFPNAAARDEHRRGHTGVLDRLAKFL